MKIGILLRHYEQHGGGVKVYTLNLLENIFALNSSHEFYLFYKNNNLVGTYKKYSNVKEIYIHGYTNFIWEQISLPQYISKLKLDILFNPKYSLPLSGSERKVFVCHGLDWYVMPNASKYADRVNHKYLIPKYCREADKIIAVSNTVKEHLINYLNVPAEKVRTVYLGKNDVFNFPVSPEKEAVIKRTKKIPDKYFLYVGQIYPPKNFGRILKAFTKVGPANGYKLVVAGEHRWLCENDIELIDKLNLSHHIQWLNWVDNEDLPVIYKSAEALLFPSLYEGFGIPAVEAMASGVPVITANRFATKEITGDASLLVDPENVDSIADAMKLIMGNILLRNQLVEAGLKRAKEFDWRKTAIQTLSVLEEAGTIRTTPLNNKFSYRKFAA